MAETACVLSLHIPETLVKQASYPPWGDFVVLYLKLSFDSFRLVASWGCFRCVGPAAIKTYRSETEF
jgi:hypothetical protein